MRISSDDTLCESTDIDLIETYLPPTLLGTSGATLVELGCGTALTTRQLAESHPDSRIIGFEVDRIQHEKNQATGGPPNLEFRLGGAQAIALPSASADAVLMLKSLHHVPTPSMDQALDEIVRVLRPGGLAYLSEPVYAGDFNDILCLFHDEKTAREAAFAAISNSMHRGALLLEREIHFLSPSRFQGFEEFEARVIGATHSEFSIDKALFNQIRDAFMRHVDENGVAVFLNPMRVDLLRKPG